MKTISFFLSFLLWITNLTVAQVVCFSPNGSNFAEANCDSLKIWDIQSGKIFRTFTGHTGIIKSVCFSPDGKFCLSGATDKTIKLWDVENGKGIQTYTGHREEVTAVCFSSDGKSFVSSSLDKKIKLWDVNTGKELRTFTGHSDCVYSVCFSPDDKFIVSASIDKTIRLLDVNTGVELRTFRDHLGWVFNVCFSQEGKYILSGSYAEYVPRTIKDNNGKEYRFDSLDISGSGVKLWNTHTGELVRSFCLGGDEGTALSFSSDGSLYMARIKANLFVWKTKDGKQVCNQYFNLSKDLDEDVKSVSISSNWKTLLVYSEIYNSGIPVKIIRLWEYNSGKFKKLITVDSVLSRKCEVKPKKLENNADPAVYSNYLLNQRKAFNYLNFKDRPDELIDRDNVNHTKIVKGTLEIQTFTNTSATQVMLPKNKMIDPIYDFEMTLRFRCNTGSNGVVGLSFGDPSSKNYYVFGKQDDEIKIKREKPKKPKEAWYGDACSEVSEIRSFPSFKDPETELMVRKVNGNYYFFYNQKFLCSLPCDYNFGTREVALVCGGNSKINVYSLNIDYFGSKAQLAKFENDLANFSNFKYEIVTQAELQKFNSENWQYIGISKNKFRSILHQMSAENLVDWQGDIAIKRDKDGSSGTWTFRNDILVECEFFFQDEIGVQGRSLNQHFVLLRGSVQFGWMDFTGDINGFPIYVHLSEDNSKFYSFIRVKYSAVNFPKDIQINTYKSPKK